MQELTSCLIEATVVRPGPIFRPVVHSPNDYDYASTDLVPSLENVCPLWKLKRL